MKTITLIGLILLASLSSSFAQRSISIGIGYRLIEEFSFNDQIQSYSNPAFLDLERDNSRLIAPLSIEGFIALGKTRERSIEAGVHVFSLNRLGLAATSGESVNRTYFSPFLKYQLQIWSSSRETIVYGIKPAVLGRIGVDQFITGNSFPTGALPTRKLRDIALGGSVFGRIKVMSNLFTEFEIQLTKWLFLYPNFNTINGARSKQRLPGNQLELKMGFSYQLLNPQPESRLYKLEDR
jgi:hypothetical protein